MVNFTIDASTIGMIINSGCIIGGAISVLIIYAFHFGGYKTRFLSMETAVKEKLPNKIDKIDEDLSSMRKTLYTIRGALVQSEAIKDSLITANSPIALTKKGMTALKDSGFVKIFKEHKTEIFNPIKSKNPETEYDVEQYAVSAIFSLSDEPYMRPLKKYTYQEGKTSYDLLYIVSIFVRDEYIKTEFKKKKILPDKS